MKLLRTNSNNPDFKKLVRELDSFLAITDGDDHAFYTQYNTLDKIKYVVVAYEKEIALGCGAIKQFDENTMEVKRMYTSPQSRGKGIASLILLELEKWALELRFKKCIIETGIRQTAAVSMYPKKGYVQINNYGQYANVNDSVCFEKQLISLDK